MCKKILLFVCLCSVSFSLFGCDNNPTPIDETKIETYTVHFDSGFDQQIDSSSVTKGESISLPTLVREGYTLLGWTEMEASTGNIVSDPFIPKSTMILYAKWNINEYTISFDSNGGTEVDSITKEYNESITQPVFPTKEGYAFGGWYVDSELTTPYIFNRVTSEDITLFAKWNVNEFTMFFNTNGGSYIEPITVGAASDVTEPINPVKNGYDFAGWYTDDTYETEYVFVTMPPENITVFAKWSEIDWNEVETYIETQLPSSTSKDILLPLEYNSYTISWESVQPNIISDNGKYSNPYQETVVTLHATIKLGNNTIMRSYNVIAEGKKSLAAPISSSYIYRNYNTTDYDFFRTLDIINCAFIYADSNGNLSGTTTLNNINTYIMPKANEYGNWVLFSVSPSSKWSDIASSSVKIDNFASNIVTMINTYGFDGVDIDWETPTSSESESFVEMMEVIYTKVKANNSNHLVTAAVAGGMWQPPRYNLEDSHQYLDYINMMTYSMVSNGGYYQNALYKTTEFDDTNNLVGKTLVSCTIEESVAIYNSYGIPNSKIIVGIPFYAVEQSRTYDSSTNSWSNWVYYKARSYHYLEQYYLNSSDWTYHYDENAGVPYLITNDGTKYISFDNRESIIEKSEYIILEGLGGMMYWEHGHDLNGTLLEALEDGLK